LRGTDKVEEEMNEMRAESAKQKLTTVISLREMWTNPCLKSPLIIAVMMQLAQQFSGINAVSTSYRYSYLSQIKTQPQGGSLDLPQRAT
jgi:hypothetical protein